MTPAVFGIEGLSLSPSERAFFSEAKPFGYILFARNVSDRRQLRALTEQLRALDGDDKLPIFIDQEGGRVARMSAPEWSTYPPAAAFEQLYVRGFTDQALQACALNYEALALDLAEVGISVTCAPVLDVPVAGAHDVIGDRAFSDDPARVAALGRACLSGLRAGGVEGVIKHIPGHGRASVDSHLALPRVVASHDELQNDLDPFRALCEVTMAMTAHVIFEQWDTQRCATLSPLVIQDVIRERIGFDGLLITDDLDMKALAGHVGDLAAEAQKAGCDIALNCWAKMNDMTAIAAKMATPSPETLRRIGRVKTALVDSPTLPTINDRQRALKERCDALLA